MRKLITEKEKNTTKITTHVISHRVRLSGKKRHKKQEEIVKEYLLCVAGNKSQNYRIS